MTKPLQAGRRWTQQGFLNVLVLRLVRFNTTLHTFWSIRDLRARLLGNLQTGDTPGKMEHTTEIFHRPFRSTPEPLAVPSYLHYFQHPLFAWLGLRPIFAQHTRAESEALRLWARGRKTVVEIGVAEGASALTLREVMDPEGVLYLIDPFHLSRFPLLNTMKRVARMTADRCQNGRVVWVEKFSFEAVNGWITPIDFLFLDGDHSEDAVQRDWQNWHQFVTVGGIAAFHDARAFAGGWTSASDGPVKVVDELFRKGSTRGWEIVDEIHSLVVVRRLV